MNTTSYVLAQEVEFIFSNHMFSPEREQLGWKVFGRRFTPPMRAQIIVPTDSAVTELAQLQGQDVAQLASATLINNAGMIGRLGPLDPALPADVATTLRVDLEAPVQLSAAVRLSRMSIGTTM